MNSRIYPFGLHLVLLALSTVVSIDVPPVGNDIADAENYPEPHPGNGSNKTPASRDHRAVREGEGRDPHQDTAISKPPSLLLTQGSCNSMFMVQCRDGMCISKNFVCDRDRDCRDGSDEDCQVQTTKSGKCKNDTFPCDNGKCIPISWHCDTSDDCGDNSDERGCEVKCPFTQFKCRSGKCVVLSSLCDGVKDCDGGEDEDNCGKSHCHKIPGFYQCESGDCVPAKKVCDDTMDCDDGSDEGKACVSKCKANNCTDLCYPTPKGPHCSCKKGLTLQSDLMTCTDENECERQYMLVCDHFCVNTNGSFSCSCESTYTLQEDGVTCKHKNPGNAFLLVAQRGSIRQLFLDGSRYAQIYSGRNESIVGLAYDPVTSSVFWGTNGRILKAPMMANALPTTLLDQGIKMAEGLAVDWTARNLYIADLRMFHILACNLEGTACHQVLKRLGHPRTVQLDILHRHMYWTDVKHGNIGKAGMDGSNPTVLVQDGLVWPNALALDPPADRLYWLDAHSDEAHSVRLDGSDRKNLHLATLQHPFSMALWEDRLYWTDWSQSHIVSCIKRDGKHVRTELKGTSKRKYFGLVLYHPAMMERVDNPCSSAQCSHLCLLSPNPAGYTCACPTGILHLAQDNHTCIDNPDRIYVLVNSLKKMYWLSPHHYGRSDIQAWMPNLLLGDIGDVEYFPGQDLVFVSDQYDGKIYSIDMKTSYATILVNYAVARRMALDWLRHNLYWLDSNSNVQVMRLTTGKGSHRTNIIRGLSSPLDIAVAPLAGLLFVSTASTNPQSQGLIQQCGLDGKSCITIVDSSIQRPLTLAVDHKHNHLYWGDHILGRIERINFNGLERIQILPPTEMAISTAVVSLMISGDYLSWTVENERTFYTVRTEAMQIEAPKITNLFLDPSEGKLLKLTRIKWELPDEMTGKERLCQNNGGCSDICVGSRLNKEVCLCQFSSQLGSDGKTCEKVQCEEHLFQCVSSFRCIPSKWRCDGNPDCSDESDEAGCSSSDEGTDIIGFFTMPLVQCPDDHLCDTDKCLPKPFVCDNHVDCEDESDEANCTHVACPVGQVKCLNGRCIGKIWLCDGDKDCPDGSDEENCPIKCSTDQYQCDNKCIANNATCDGKKDCDDGKDEEELLCGGQRNRVCPAGKIPCLSTHTSGVVCIDHEQRCNGVQDCPRGEDESRNVCSDCTREEFQCPASRICIPLGYLCDRHLDCEPDGADEVNCTNPTTATTTDLQTLGVQGPCGDDEFPCEDGQCLPNSKVCDGHRDCIDGSDEQKSCQLRCDVLKCQHYCHSTPIKAYCSCHAGYHLAPDFRSCLDDQECMNERLCSQGCEERKGTFRCTCLPGYRLVDLTTCKREDGDDWLALAVHAGIFNFTHTLRLQDAFPSPHVMFDYITSFAVDPMTGDIFFSDEHRRVIGKLTRADGVIKEEIILRERSLPRSLCYDPRRRNLYVAELFGGPRERSERSVGGSRNQGDQDTTIPTEILWSSIMACNLDGKGCSVVFGSNVSEVTSLAMAVTEELLFFCNNDVKFKTGQLMMSYLDGTKKKEIWGKIVRCGNLALDEAKRRVYWADSTQETIETVTWEGDGHHFVHRKQQVWFPVGLAVVGPNVFWVNRGSSQMIQCPKLHDRGDCYKREHSTTLLGLFVAPLPVINETKGCDNVSCSHLCVSGGSGCICLAGYQKSSTDLTKCEKLTACDTPRCEGGGTCEAHTAEHFVCRCPEGRYGYKCELGKVIDENSNAAVTATVVVVIIIAVLMLALLYWWKRCPFTFWKRRGHGSGQQGFQYVNPAFGVIRDEPILEGEAQPARGNGLYPRLPHEHPPPYAPASRSSSLIQNFANSPATMHKDSQINTSDDSAVASTTDSILASQQSEVNLTTPICQHPTVMEDNKDFSKFDYSPFNPSKV